MNPAVVLFTGDGAVLMKKQFLVPLFCLLVFLFGLSMWCSELDSRLDRLEKASNACGPRD